MAGGTVAMPLINDGHLAARAGHEPAPRGHRPPRAARRRAGHRRRGDALPSSWPQDVVPLLGEAARHTASWSIRNMGTVGGNLFTPPPGGDVAVALLALDAQVRAGRPARRARPPAGRLLHRLHDQRPGPRRAARGDHRPHAARETAFIKFGRKHANTPAVVTVAVALERRDGRVSAARIALGAAGPHPIRATGAEAVLTGSALDAGRHRARGRGRRGRVPALHRRHRHRVVPPADGRRLRRGALRLGRPVGGS